MREPYLSIIIASRNDEHGGNILRRTQTTLDSLLTQLERYQIESELVLVDWNPPADRPPLKDIIVWPKLDYCVVRVITVPPEVHLKCGYSKEQPMRVIVAYNTGVRRARGKFILPGTIDSLYSNELMTYIASKELKENERYRIDRIDVNKDVVWYDTIEERLAYCRENVIRVNSRESYIIHLILYHSIPRLHTNACGDFQLMSKHYWHLLRGYAETVSISAHVDTLLSYASYAVGVQEVVLKSPMYLYHIDHDNKFNDRTKRVAQLSLPFVPERLRCSLAVIMGREIKSSVHRVPVLDDTTCRRMCRDIVTGKQSYILNNEDWGLGKEVLEEVEI